MSTSVDSQANSAHSGGSERANLAAGTATQRSSQAGAASLPDVVKVFSKLLPRQIQDELALAKLELKDKGIKVGKGVAFVVVGLVFLLLATIALVVAAVAGLAQVMPFWLSALIVAAFFLLVLIVLAAVGALMIKSAMPLNPVRAIRGLKYDLGVVKEGSAYTEARVRREEAEATERKAQEKKEKKAQSSHQPPAPTEAQLRQRLSVRREKLKELRDDAEARKNHVQNSAVGFVDRTRSKVSGASFKAASSAEQLGERVGPLAVAAAAGTAFLVFLIKLVRRSR
ncbi:phage holin family protein [Kocuria sp.]|uniref:phage holin family protein n=1 Tax=Kocuria sp. TaxID=1871328 RepID=UPI0026DEF442|nr:phage holin family protein [Kocuria sp.]MDO5618809.1 phage holin family protein [Kocuria sp.]